MGNKLQKQIVVVAIIINSGGKILLQKRDDPMFPKAHGKWEFPGGGIDDKESKEEALQRECKEEIACRVIIGRLLPCVQARTWISHTGKQLLVEVYGYQCKITDNCKPKPSNKEVAQIRWFSRKEIKRLDTIPGIVDFVDQV